MLILDSQKVEILKKIANKGFSEQDFEFEEQGTSITLKYKYLDFFFRFYVKGSTNFSSIRHKPAKDRVEYDSTGGRLEWAQLVSRIQAWGEYLKREVEARDYLQRSKVEASLVRLIHSSHTIENDPIDDHDVKKIQESVDDFTRRIIEDNPDLTTGQIQTINEIRDILKEEADKQGYRTWIQIFASNLLIIVAEICSDPQQIEQIVDLAKAIFSWLGTPLLQ